MYGDPLYDAARLVFFWSWYPQWAGIDIRAEVAAHWVRGREGSAGPPPDFDNRLIAYLLHIGWMRWRTTRSRVVGTS